MNNFLFNLLKEEESKQEENKQKEVKTEEIKKDIPVISVTKKKKKTFFGLFPGDNPRREALIKLSIGFGFCILLVIFINMFGTDKSNTLLDDVKPEKDNTALSVFDYIDKNNYTFTYQIDTDIDNVIQSYTFWGYNSDGIIYGERISDNMKLNYKYMDNSYYCMQDDVYVLCDIDEVFLNKMYNYINLDFIRDYISKGKLNYTTSYTDGGTLKNYSVYFKDFIASYTNDDYFVINLTENNDSYDISIDYTNLSKYSNPLVFKFVVDMKIGKIIGSE